MAAAKDAWLSFWTYSLADQAVMKYLCKRVFVHTTRLFMTINYIAELLSKINSWSLINLVVVDETGATSGIRGTKEYEK